MTLIHPEVTDRDHPEGGECAVCGAVTFHLDVIDAGGELRVVGIHCAVCGDHTGFHPASESWRGMDS